VFSKNIEAISLNRLRSGEIPPHYNKKDENGNIYYLKPLRAMGIDGHRDKRPSMYFPIYAPDGTPVFPKNQDGSDSRWQWGAEKVERESDRVEFVKTKTGWSVYFRIFFENTNGRPPETIWPHTEVGSNRTSKKEIKDLFGSEVFDTPKPEALVSRALEISTVPKDLVLDSFGGSGTTGAVAQKMGRRWIMVELGEHCHTHIIPRLKKVIDGKDEGGITKAVEWKGGGGFRYYHIAPTLLEKDAFDNLVISKQYNPAMLAEAMCKIMGFQYAPGDLYWQQGRSTETDFIYVTTQTLTRDHLAALSDEVGKKRSLLVCCAAFRGKADAFPNLTLKKIPLAVLQKCEWGHDDYSLNVANLPQAPDPVPARLAGEAPLEPKQARKRRARTETMPSLFDGGAE
jgi:adenine-specific DNA-methyltransferase